MPMSTARLLRERVRPSTGPGTRARQSCSAFAKTTRKRRYLLQTATVVLDVINGVADGTIGVQVELACGGTAHYLPSETTLHEMRFTTSWALALPPPSRRQLRSSRIQPPRQLQSSNDVVHGDVNGDGTTNALDLTAVVNYFKVPSTIDLSTMSDNQRLWLDANRDGVPANAGDVLYAARAFAGATVYPDFELFECPTVADGELSVTVACYSAGQALLGAVDVAVERVERFGTVNRQGEDSVLQGFQNKGHERGVARSRYRSPNYATRPSESCPGRLDNKRWV